MRDLGNAAFVAVLGLIMSAMLTMGQSCVAIDTDSDLDGYLDSQEITNDPPTDPYDPLDTPFNPIDSDHDGCSDYGETTYGHCDGNPSTAVARVTVSGSVAVSDNLILDEDTSDPNNSYASNNTISSAGAQVVPNPCTIGGFLGSTSHGDDQRDVFLAQMAAGQAATLLLATPDDNDFDLYLYDETGTDVLDSSVGVDKAEQVIAPDNGTYLIEVRGYSVINSNDEGGLYSLLVGESVSTALTTGLRRNKLSTIHPFVEGEILVKYSDEFKAAQAMTERAVGLQEINDGSASGGFHRLRLASDVISSYKAAARAQLVGPGMASEMSPTLAMIKALRRQKDVECAEPNYIRRATLVPNDEFYIHQWHYPLIGLPEAWDLTTGDSDVIVAVIDTGVAMGHPDLAGQVVGGYDFISDLSTSMDGNGLDSNADDPGDSPGFGISSSFHGTHVSGTIAARTNNSTGVAGIAWNARIMPIRVLGRNGEGTDYDIAQGVRYAAGLGNDSGTTPSSRADIINMSLGGPGSSSTLTNAVVAARQAGVIVVAAAGNASTDADDYFPGSISGVVNVSAIDQSRELAWYSNYGFTVKVCAPGGNMEMDYDGDGLHDGVLSTLKNDSDRYTYVLYDGTSMACPHIAGVIALMMAVNPDLTPSDVDQLLAGTHSGTSIDIVDDLGIAGRDTYYGYGLINARNAVRAAAEIAGTVVSDTPQLRVVPQDVSLGTVLTSADVSVSNVGGGTLSVTSADSEQSWISVSPGSGGQGSYEISVSRAGLDNGVYSGTVTFSSNGGSAEVTVRMIVGSVTAAGGNVGTLYVLLVDPETLDVYGQDTTSESQDYAFSFSDVYAGEYRLYAGTDMNNDGYIDDEGEAFGGYPVLSKTEVLDVADDLAGLSFSASYIINIQKPTILGQDNTAGPVAPRRLKRLW